MMKYMMVVFGLFFYKVAAGLCLYFIASSVWGFTERKLLGKKKVVVEETSEREGSRFWHWVMDRVQGQRDAIQGAAAAASGTRNSPSSERGRGKQKKKSRKEQGSSANGPENGKLGKLRQWWQDVLKEAQKRNR
jgi:YidC/Oxa1 family membrane protein insertase